MKRFLIAIGLVTSISLISFTARFSHNYAYTATLANRENLISKEEEETNISHILFGIAGSANTWKNRSGYSGLWWRPNVTRGFVWLDKTPPGNESWPETFPPYRISQDTSAFKFTCSFGYRSAMRIARIVKESFELGFTNVRWFVMGDDDTVFFTENLLTVLAKYDHNKMYYIGGSSYTVDLDVLFSYGIACGGGGFAISYPLAAELVKILDGCINRYHYLYGSDQKIAGCVAELGVPLTKELGFHQMDIEGSPRGFFAAHPIAPFVSLHHLGLVDPLIPLMSRIESVKKVIEAYKKDPSRTMQQSLCYDLKRNWSLSVSWGYSVQLYPWVMNARELGMPVRTFKTIRRMEGPFTFSTRPDYVDPCKRPIEYYLDQVTDIRNGETLTSYNRVGDINKQCENEHYGPALAIPTVNVKARMLSPQVWRQAPRRQCCEVIDGEDGIGSVLHIRIRGCNQWESVTPPFHDKYGEFAYFQRRFLQPLNWTRSLRSMTSELMGKENTSMSMK
ncbi:PREDICTED: uncharacterized protein LOC109236251 [Nicotiana attenuata]|uniref:Uncharacterized protein n=1 Tax=Nicotiana attenuata TaxID=49451 RepID=A0A1J6HVF2_NICAT|nr:PREDICTED: uncharacterized protein LOC109236251 [Nicotiana attenuata]OIS96315.1 hypothetical protein A4A49_01600 [Nicotiana attenuata]